MSEHARLTTTEYALLGMLGRYGARSGYELLKLAEAGIGHFWSPAKSHVYDVLPRLERGGCARRRIVSQSTRPDKHLWRITRRGGATLAAWINTIDANPFDERGVFLLKLFFGDQGDPEQLVRHVELFRDQAKSRLAALRTVQSHEWTESDEELPRMTLRQGLAGTAAQLRWAQEVLPELQARATAYRSPRQV